ncbi:DEAD/DEAH box RNA helicase family protein, partial [Striga asiatica]
SQRRSISREEIDTKLENEFPDWFEKYIDDEVVEEEEEELIVESEMEDDFVSNLNEDLYDSRIIYSMRTTTRGGGHKTLAAALRAMSQDDDSDEEHDQTPSPHGQRGGPVRRGGHTSRSSMPNRLSSPPSSNRPHTPNIILHPPSFTPPDPFHGATPLTLDASSDDPLHDVLPSPVTSPSQLGSMLSASSSVCSSLMCRIPIEIESDE